MVLLRTSDIEVIDLGPKIYNLISISNVGFGMERLIGFVGDPRRLKI